MMDAQELFDELCQPFPADYVDWRVGATRKPYDFEIEEKKFKEGDTVGKPLCYIDARTVMDRFDTICGPDGWQCNYTPGVNGSIICNIGVRIEGEWIWKADGAGATDFEGEKGALSDAFKRAAVRWGVGRYLYDMDAFPVALKNGKYITKESLTKLTTYYDETAPKGLWGVRGGIQAYRLLKKVVDEFVGDPASAQDFKSKNAAEIAQLPVAMRRHLNAQLDRIGGPQREAAE